MPRSIPSLHLLIVLLSSLFAAGTVQAADTAAGKTAAKVLLEKGWKKTAGKDALVDHENLEKPPLAGDSSVLAAKWLVLMYQGRWDDALAGLEKFLKAEPAEDFKIHALQAKAWILTVKKEYRQAMVVADQLSQAAVPNPQITDKTLLEAQEDAIAFVGRLAGFIEGPCDKAGDQAVRTKLEERVLERLDETRKEKFKEAKTEVLEEFERLMSKAKEAKEDTKADADADKTKKLAELSEEDANLSKKANEVEDKAKKLGEEVKTKLQELERLEMPLVQQMTFMQGQLTSLNTQLNQQQQLVRALAQPNNNKQGGNNAANAPQLRQAENAVANLRGQINIANNNLMIAQTRQNEIRQTRVAVNNETMRLRQQLAAEKAKIDRDREKIANIKARTDRTKAGTGSKALSIEIEARSFSTYDTFPLEEMRETLKRNVQ